MTHSVFLRVKFVHFDLTVPSKLEGVDLPHRWCLDRFGGEADSLRYRNVNLCYHVRIAGRARFQIR